MDKNQLRALLTVLLGRHKLHKNLNRLLGRQGIRQILQLCLSIPHFHIQLQQQLYFSTVTTSN